MTREDAAEILIKLRNWDAGIHMISSTIGFTWSHNTLIAFNTEIQTVDSRNMWGDETEDRLLDMYNTITWLERLSERE